MNNTIEFKAKDFRFGSQNQYGGRMFVTKNGVNREVFDLGTVDDWKRQGAPGSRDHFGTWIFAKKDLEPHTDYVFRIEVVSDGTLCDGSELRAAIFDVLDPDDKTVYPLAQSRFAPSVSKKAADGGLVRVFELPYSTGDGAVYQINIFAYDCRVTLDTPAAPEEYASLEDCSYADWRACSTPAKELQVSGAKNGKGFEDLGDIVDHSDEDEDEEDEEIEYDLEIGNRRMDEQQFAEQLGLLDDGQNAIFANVMIERSDPVKSVDPGDRTDGCRIEVANALLCTGAVKLALDKLGDGCRLTFANCKETYDGSAASEPGSGFDGCIIEFANTFISQVTFANLLARVGDGCKVNIIAAEIQRAGDAGDGQTNVGRLIPEGVEGLKLYIQNSRIPAEMIRELREELKGTFNSLECVAIKEY
ncbi:MAG: hypothetical protein IKO92_04280 [Clostridia bacterium]|nr:hypothetical protein [Clostridia bacterium]